MLEIDLIQKSRSSIQIPALIASEPGFLFVSWRGQGTLEWTLEHDPEKWIPVFRKDHAQTKR
jgi:hypothetical protein